MKIVLIEWLDSKEGSSGWEYKKEVEPLNPVSCKSVGFLIENNIKYKTLVFTISEHQILSRISSKDTDNGNKIIHDIEATDDVLTSLSGACLRQAGQSTITNNLKR